jgi:hypothetical protein
MELIETKPYDYSVFKYPDGTYQLNVHRPISIGMDIIHKLTEKETKAYLKNGIQSLEARIAHMTEHYKDYTYMYWR